MLVDAIAAILLAADLFVVSLSVFYRYVLAAPIEWADDVARGLMVALSFFGAAGALARNENIGVAFFVAKTKASRSRQRVDALAALVVFVDAGSVAWNAMALGRFTTGQTTGSGLPLELTFYPMGAGALCMTIFALAQLCSPAAVRNRVCGRSSRWLWPARPMAGRFVGVGTTRAGPPMLLGSSAAWSAACRSASRWRSPR